jgi:hypothetical protein
MKMAMKLSIFVLIGLGLAVSCMMTSVSCVMPSRRPFENIAYVANSTFATDRSLGMMKIYYPAYSAMNFNAANSNLNAKGIYVIGYGDLVQSRLLKQYQLEYNKNAELWLKKNQQTDIDTLLNQFKNK